MASQVNAQIRVHAVTNGIVGIDLVIKVFPLACRDAPRSVSQVVSHKFDGVIAVRIDPNDLLARTDGVVVVLVVGAV